MSSAINQGNNEFMPAIVKDGDSEKVYVNLGLGSIDLDRLHIECHELVTPVSVDLEMATLVRSYMHEQRLFNFKNKSKRGDKYVDGNLLVTKMYDDVYSIEHRHVSFKKVLMDSII